MMTQSISSEVFNKGFIRFLAQAYEKHDFREKERSKLNKHIEKVKNLSSNKKVSKKQIENEFKKLEKKLENVLLLEKGVPSRPINQDVSKEIRQRVKDIEKKVEAYILLMEERKQKVRLLERRVREKSLTEEEKRKNREKQIKDVHSQIRRKQKEDTEKVQTEKVQTEVKRELRHKLYDLQERYYELKLQGIPKSKLNLIETKIKKLKEKV
jgi:hypothetical protein|tara:strand:- start:1486 stop:2118 length:633 start_codon:yes stop_codon:yes gene_type:complete